MDIFKKVNNLLLKHGFKANLTQSKSYFRRTPNVFFDNEYIYKFGFTENEIDESKKQNDILNFLNNKLTLIEIPKVIYFFYDNKYSVLIYKKIQGEVIDWCDYNKFNNKEKNVFSEHLGETIYELHSNLNTSDNKFNLISEYGTEQIFCEYLIRRIYKKEMSLDDKRFCAKLVYDNLELFKKVDGDLNQIIIHNDINIQNIIIKNKKIYGLFDFDNSELSQPYCDFRFFYFHDSYSGNIAYKKYLSFSNDIYDKEKLFLVGLTAGLSGVVHRHNYMEALEKLKTYIKQF